MIIPQARIWLTMSHDGLLPKIFGAVHPRFRTPHISTVITGVLAATAAGLLPIGILGELVSIGTLIAFMVVCVGVVVLRYTRPDLPRPFKVKSVWFVAIGGVVFCGSMAGSLPAATWLRLLARAHSASRCTSSAGANTAACVSSAKMPVRGRAAARPARSHSSSISGLRRKRVLQNSTASENAIAKYREPFGTAEA